MTYRQEVSHIASSFTDATVEELDVSVHKLQLHTFRPSWHDVAMVMAEMP